MQLLSPSKAHIWVPCPGSAGLSEDYIEKQEPTEATLEGRAAHKVVEWMAKGRDFAVGQECEGTYVTQEMVDCAEEFLEYLSRFDDLEIEVKLPVDQVDPGMNTVIDARASTDSGRTLVIADYKFGHRPVHAYRNYQLLTSAAANGAASEDHSHIIFVIYQPRCYMKRDVFDTWDLSVDEYYDRHFPQIKNAATEAKSDDPSFNIGPQCVHCPARRACKALQESALSAVEISQQKGGRDLTPSELGKELQTLHKAQEVLKARVSGLEEQAIQELDNGNIVPGYTKQPSTGRARWKQDAKSIISFGDVMGIDLRKPVEPITPAQAKKLGLPQSAVDNLSERPSTGAKLAPINFNKTEKVFQK